MIKKFKYLLISLFLTFSFIIFIIFSDITKKCIYDCLNLWLNKVLIALIPSYLFSSLLLNYPFISKFLYHPLNKIMHFENQKACSLFLLTFISGCPTSSFLIIDSIDKTISKDEGIRLLKGAVLNSPLFTIIILPRPFGYYVYFIQVFISLIFYIINKPKKQNFLPNIKDSNYNLLDIIDNCPNVMLNILSTMLFVSILKIPLQLLLSFVNLDFILPFTFLLDSLELTTGITNILSYNLNLKIKNLLCSFMLSFGGIAIIIQIMNKMKKTSLPKTSLIMSRILHGICVMIILFILIFFI